MPPSTDPNQIDINLSLLPGESEAAVQSLISSMHQISQQLASFKAPTNDAAIAAALKLFEQTGMPHHGVTPAASRATAGDQDPVEKLATKIDDTLERQRQQADTQEQDDARRRQVDDHQAEVDRLYARRVAEAKLQATSFRQGLRYAVRGTTPEINSGRPGDPTVPEEVEAEAYASLVPTFEGRAPRLRRFINRAAQVTAPGGSVIDRQAAYKQAERDVRERRQQQGPATSAGGDEPPDGGERSEGASLPPNAPDEMIDQSSSAATPAWMAHVKESKVREPFEMPRFGEFTAQDTLNMMSSVLGRRAFDAQGDRGSAEAGFMQGNLSALFARMASATPILSNFNTNLQRRGLDAASLRSLGIAAGADVGGTTSFNQISPIDIPGLGDFAVQNPIDFLKQTGKGAELLGRYEVAGLDSPYLSGQQARRIGAELSMSGLDAETATGALRNAIGQVRGDVINNLSPERIVQTYQASVRAGGGSLNDFVKAMNSLGPSARAARMSLEETAAAADQYAEAIQAQGGLYMQGHQAGTDFQTLTGMPMQIGQQLRSNGLIQGMMFGQTGILPQLQGQLPESAAIPAEIGTVRQLVDMFGSGLGPQTIETANGTMRISGRQQAFGMAGNILGLPTERIQALYQQSDQIGDFSAIQGDLDAYMQDFERVRGDDRGETRVNSGRSRNGVSLVEILNDARRAGLDVSELHGLEGRQLAEAIQNQVSEKRVDQYGNADDPNKSINEQLRAQIELAPNASQFFNLIIENLPANAQRKARQLGLPTESKGPPERKPNWKAASGGSVDLGAGSGISASGDIAAVRGLGR